MLYDKPFVETALSALIEADPIMARLIDQFKPVFPEKSSNQFCALNRSIVGQQLSVKAARTIFARFAEATNDLQINKILSLSEQQAKDIGLSRQKYSYILDLATRVNSNKAFFDLEQLEDEEVIERLIQVKGVGRWTAEMFLIFSLSRPDIFAVDDLGLRRAIEKSYGVVKDSDKSLYLEISKKWQPYRSIASLYLWSSLENS